MEIVVHIGDLSAARAELSVAGQTFPCAVGRAGASADKVEGDLKTPLGRFAIRTVYTRPDRVQLPHMLSIPTYPLQPHWGWCDDPDDPAYNQRVDLPYAGAHEKLWREDNIYDVVVVLGHNDDPPVAGRGSAIFMHIAREGFSGTEGCVALRPDDLWTVLALCDGDDWITITT